jgi:uncharacterized protein (TIGR02466 family)
MEKISILPQFVYKFSCGNEKLLSDVCNTLLLEDWEDNNNNTRSVDSFLHKRNDYYLVCKWFYDCVQEVKNDLEMECEELRITQCWSNKSVYGQWHHPHTHPNSIISGIFYVTNSNANTWFSTPNIWTTFNGENYDNLKLNYDMSKNRIIHKQQTIRGDLIIFPSSLYHSVDKHLIVEQDRYSMSFNTFPSGKIGNFSYLSGLEIFVR